MSDADTILGLLLKTLPDCGNSECPIHSKTEEPETEPITADEANRLAMQTAAGAHQALETGNAQAAKLLQDQTGLWHEVADRARRKVVEERIDAQLSDQIDGLQIQLEAAKDQITGLQEELQRADQREKLLQDRIEELEAENVSASSGKDEAPVS